MLRPSPHRFERSHPIRLHHQEHLSCLAACATTFALVALCTYVLYAARTLDRGSMAELLRTSTMRYRQLLCYTGTCQQCLPAGMYRSQRLSRYILPGIGVCQYLLVPLFSASKLSKFGAWSHT
ncbi:hypothetical protein IAQ61_004924 [Plenodomus lingam]|uniref:uncharacterized protein n=1 Tax=Leptosphaeria maculans TaxID=5022 RepID=UPI0033255A6E|nr:hypothetical protein IAQ61_004924 [Plenodomus lingam]